MNGLFLGSSKYFDNASRNKGLFASRLSKMSEYDTDS